ncbi:Slc8a2 [Symbiodinium natans]|uniref:Slc8a2 protein n=1 Tax=Symbiodinium natans TaxID=878477 RepID=A0A812JR16_9DINO|nr:Slc8a2 [Symbiodinium natans]
MAFRCETDYMWLPAFGEDEKNWPNGLRIFLYVLGLFYCFLGVAVVSDVFMNAIERITSQKKRVRLKSTGKIVTQTVWNDTMANLTLMALGSSAPEILLSVIEIMSNEMYIGDLGSGTVVGSAAFNLLVISAVCVCAIPDGEVRYIKDTKVYCVTATFSILAYVWLLLILMVISPDICELWEAVVTFLLFPVLLAIAFAADKGYFTAGGDDDHHEQNDNFYGAIPPDVTKEELAEIEQGIREEYNHKISDDQLVRVIQHMYIGKPSRAFYRHAAMEGIVGGKKADFGAHSVPVNFVTAPHNTADELNKGKLVEVGWATDRYAFLESCHMAKLQLMRAGLLDREVTVQVTSREGTAKANSDFKPVDEAVTFAPGETLKDYYVEIIDDAAYEEDEEFYLDLSQPKLNGVEPPQDVKVRIIASLATATVVIVDDDEPGKLRFQKEEVEVKEREEETTLRIIVERFNGATGPIECRYYTEDNSAIAGYDYVEASGTLFFEDTVQTATIEITIKPKGRYENTSSFNVYLVEPSGGATFDRSTDGGSTSCICHVVIKADDERKAALDRIASQINWNKHALGYSNWKEQFRDAVFMSRDDDEEEDGGRSCMDVAIHFIGMPWKLAFAFIPPVDYCNGWCCFFVALGMIAILTAVVGDLANLVGCTLNIGPEITAITFVALGTSLPDTFASKTAAIMDPYADASIGNVTGSNSVNVFLGLGMPWTIGAIYWQTLSTSGATFSTWLAKLQEGGKYYDIRSSIVNYNNLQTAVFVTPAGSLWFNLLIFSCNALCAIMLLYLRRRTFGGELGGPRRWQLASAAFLVFQWCVYIGASSAWVVLETE